MGPPPPALAVPADLLDDSRALAGPPIAESFRSVPVPYGASGFWRKLFAFTGPGCLVAVGYMDPGNWATDIAGGSQFGYAILPVILVSNLVALFLQHLALKLGIASGCDLAQACRTQYGKRTAFILWAAAEIAIIACDLAEVIGTAIALKLLFGIPLLFGVALTILDTLFLLALMRQGVRAMEALIASLLVLIGCCFVFELVIARPEVAGLGASLADSARILGDPQMLYIALGVFGATVMPHNLYLHSSIVQSRRYLPTQQGKREAIFFATLDSSSALTLALFINAAILVVAAAAFHRNGLTAVVDITEAHRLLSPLLGTTAAGILFGVALLASGQNSTLTGTLAGQVVMEGMLGLRMSPFLQRLLTRCLAIVPAFGVVALGTNGGVTRLLIFSQVVLGLQLGFAVIPLVMFTSDKKMMGPFVNSRRVRLVGLAVAVLIVAVNGWLVIETFTQ